MVKENFFMIMVLFNMKDNLIMEIHMDMVNIIMKKSIEDLEYRFDHDPKPTFLTEDN